MTKEEKIKEAYGEYWKYVKNIENIKSNGSFEFKGRVEDYNFNGEFKIIWIGVNFFIAIPFDLQGIENNNGWIKIESEGYLPKEELDYFILYKNEVHYFFGRICDLNECTTHYQKIIKPKPPIY